MNTKLVTILSVCVAVVVAAVAAIVVSMNRADAAKAFAEAEAAQADTEAAQAKAERALADQEREKRQAAEAEAKAAADNLAAKKEERLAAEAAADEAKAKEEAAKASAEAEKAKSETARAQRDKALAEAETVRAEAAKTNDYLKAQSARAEAELAKLETEKLKADKIIAEAKLIELRKIDFETLESQLLEWKLDLEERERALTPEKTITDLAWAGGQEDSIIDDKGNIVKQVKVKYDPEKDGTIPESSRRLAKANRLVSESSDSQAQKTRDAVVGSIVRLYEQALRENRVIDAEFYRKSILSMYPDWKYKVDEKAE